jgi:beta-exotoxin I transport system ATP-binding protein
MPFVPVPAGHRDRAAGPWQRGSAVADLAAIETTGLTKAFGAVRALVDLDLRVEMGEIFGFLGPNGAGKSTTIRAILDLHRPTAGTARLLGLDSHRDAVEIHRRTGYLPGDLALFERMTAREHIGRFARARDLPDVSRAEALAERFGLDLDTHVRELSKGNRQKVGIVLSFMHQPELLVLDEPTSGLDPLMKDEFERLLRETSDSGRTVFLSSHELDEVQRVADRVGIIKQGHLVRTDTVEGLRASAPRIFEVRFASPVDPTRLGGEGVRVVAAQGPLVTIEVTGPVGPLLQRIAELGVVDLVSRQAGLDELFLDFYRERVDPEAESAR